jgi:hypothetical protein
MPALCLCLTALAIAILYCGWSDYSRRRTKMKRERIAFMLWMAANNGA